MLNGSKNKWYFIGLLVLMSSAGQAFASDVGETADTSGLTPTNTISLSRDEPVRPTPPPPPKKPTVTRAGSTITVNWLSHATAEMAFIQHSVNQGQWIDTGSSATDTIGFTGAPGSSYRFQVRSCNPNGCSAFSPVSDAIAVPSVYTVTATAGSGGSISPSSRTIEHGLTTTFTLSPNSGYRVASATGCGGSRSGNTYTTGVISAACTVTASFERIPYTVTATAGSGGSISPSSITVGHGFTTTFTLSPNSGYRVASATGCGGSRSGNTYTTGVISAACTVTASFERIPYMVTATAGSGGSISPSSITIGHGLTTTFTLSPNSGYRIGNVTGCGGTRTDNVFTTGSVTQACSITAEFTAISGVKYLHTDILGSVIAESDDSGAIVEQTEYKPFGQKRDN